MRNICVWRDGSWVTPPLAGGCLDGVVRSWMLATGKVKESRIRAEELVDGEWVLTSNAVEGTLNHTRLGSYQKKNKYGFVLKDARSGSSWLIAKTIV